MRSTLIAVALALCAACDCEDTAPRSDHAAAWARLSRCLSGSEPVTRERLDGITLSAELEDVREIAEPPAPAGAMGGPATDGPDRRRWPRRCAHYAEALEDELRGQSAVHARQVADDLADGEIHEALYVLAETARGFPAADAAEVVAPPEPASPLARSDAPLLVEGQRCVATVVLADVDVSPSRPKARVVCEGGSTHECTLSGPGLERIECTAAASDFSVWSQSEVTAGDTTFSVQHEGEGCAYRVGSSPIGREPCGPGAWIRPCRAGVLDAAAFVHMPRQDVPGTRIALPSDGGWALVTPSVYAQGNVLVDCDASSIRFHWTSSETFFVSEEYRPGMLRPPSRTRLTVHQERCTATACSTSEGERLAYGGRGSSAPVGERVVVVELVNRDDGDGLVAHVGPLTELGDDPPRWVLDPRDGARIGLVGEIGWAVGPDAAVALVADIERGLVAIRFTEDGSFAFVAP